MSDAPDEFSLEQAAQLEQNRAEWPKFLEWVRSHPPLTLDDLEQILHARARDQTETIFISGAVMTLRITASGKSDEENKRDIKAFLRACRHILLRDKEADHHPFRVVQGGLDKAAERPQPEVAALVLSPRQRECLQLLNEGLDRKQVGKTLKLSPATVAQHLQGAYRKLGVTNGRQAVFAARRLRLI